MNESSENSARETFDAEERRRKAELSKPMSSAPMRYTDDGTVDWGNMWDSFCVLASAGGPAHRDTLLVPEAGADPNSEAYQSVQNEIIRGVYLVSGLQARPATAGWIGYMIQQSVENALKKSGSTRLVTTVLTQVEVDPKDEALSDPTKFIGHAIPETRALKLESEGHPIKIDSRGHYRRVVGSPDPIAIHEIELIRTLVAEGTIVIACGGGGIPVYHDKQLGLEGVDAVVDKDLAASVLARELGAELLLILTDVDAVYSDWGKQEQKALSSLSIKEADDLLEKGAFGEGSMAPKVRAAVDYVRRTGGRAIITELSRGLDAVHGRAGTAIAR